MYVDILVGDASRSSWAKRSLGRWLHGLSAIESYGEDRVIQREDPEPDLLSGKEFPVPLDSNFLQSDMAVVVQLVGNDLVPDPTPCLPSSSVATATSQSVIDGISQATGENSGTPSVSLLSMNTRCATSPESTQTPTIRTSDIVSFIPSITTDTGNAAQINITEIPRFSPSVSLLTADTERVTVSGGTQAMGTVTAPTVMTGIVQHVKDNVSPGVPPSVSLPASDMSGPAVSGVTESTIMTQALTTPIIQPVRNDIDPGTVPFFCCLKLIRETVRRLRSH